MVDLKDARDLFFKEIETPAGTTCPCCDRYAKLYKRKLNTGMVRTLVWLYMRNAKFGAYAWIDVPRTAPRRTLNSAETGKLAHWGLAENKPNEDDPSKKHTGFWRITRRGRRFVQGRIRIPSHVYLYDNERWGMTTETKVNIEDALGEPFDYQELMEAS
jgi:hypothetical protein